MSKKDLRILVIGQTPPPFGGQAMMIEYMLNNKYEGVQMYHVRMCFSREMNERGKISLYKITHIFWIIKQAYLLKFKYKIDALYYPPSNSPKVSVLRDIILLLFIRPIFKKTIFHFHAAGIMEEIPKMNPIIKMLALIALKKPDLAITSSVFNPQDGVFLEAKRNVIVPLGVPDEYPQNLAALQTDLPEIKILFVGLLNSTKGEGVLLEAVHQLHEQGYKIQLQIAGKFESEEYREAFFADVKKYGVENNVEYLGIIKGKEKEKAFCNADIFCFPSYFVSESFGVVLLEAMQYKLPIVATRWRGIQSIVEDGKSGYLVDIKNATQVAAKIKILIDDPEFRKTMGDYSREVFLQKYTIEKYIENLNESFLLIND
ncbi:glycosyltransferase family 4 protein [Mucilaginibacter rubeus]|uniref:Glycosyltransferase family 4 protein n=1 Tax=Mucilaginibacter rubeus TaxID=2027860 RepID=A0A5C1I1A9_9SPHI|nr:glycosyltransferase family 4 protein [Mucilaginibacter rubeus]QEM11992.1 glycosyltransferase family 4 protein [Mucilaginibacter rubeus]